VNRRTQAAIFLLGAALFAVLVNHIGLAALAAGLADLGWLLVPIVALHAAVYALNAGAWSVILAGESGRPPFWRTYALAVSGFALNFLTPVVAVGGEPYRAAVLAPTFGVRRAAGAVLVYKMVNAASSVVLWSAALIVAALLAPRYAPGFLAGLAVTIALAAVLLAAFRAGGLVAALDLFGRWPGLRRLAALLEPRRAVLAALDTQVREFYHGDRRRFALAVGLDVAARAVAAVELVLVGVGIGVHVDYAHAAALWGLTALGLNLMFFVPFELGSREGSFYLAFSLLGFDTRVGVFAGVVSRLRELAWIAVGLVLVWAARHRAAAPTPTRSSPAASSSRRTPPGSRPSPRW
jgi:hypothetical protein